MRCATLRFLRVRVLWVLAVLVSTGGRALADSAADTAALARLERGLGALASVRAEFTQDLVVKDGSKPQHAAGTLSLKRPGRFRWDYTDPRQVIVCDGEHLWLYDPDLEQVTVRRVRESLAQTPAMLLSGEARVRDGFVVHDGGRLDGLDWTVLVPKAGDTDYREIRLGFAGDLLKRLEFADKLNQRTVIELRKLERNVQLPESLFRFVAPPGVDVIGSGTR